MGLFCVGLFPSLVFPASRNPFSICSPAGLVQMYSLNFRLSGKLLISPSNLTESFWVECSWLLVLLLHHFKCIMPFPLACSFC